jgi:antibiotic biosynthesis monooxygenase (ABM) superfamily enzyme
MDTTQLQPGPITLVISELVEPSQVPAYETWTKGINCDAREMEGFLGVEIIRPRDRSHPEYLVIVKFDTYDNLHRWLVSPIYRAWMEQAGELIAARSQQHLPNGLELWFTLPQRRTALAAPQPPYYKQVVLGVLGVYPLILLANVLLGPLLGGLHSLLGLFISVIFVSALLTYPVLPWLSKGLEFWLYPTARRPRRRP